MRFSQPLCAALAATLACPLAFAAGAYDGDWTGTTTGGATVILNVADDELVGWYFGGNHQCSDGQMRYKGWGIGAGGPIEGGAFEASVGVSEDRPISNSSVSAILEGVFTSPDTAEGTLRAGSPVYTGVGLQTASCIIVDTWTATRDMGPNSTGGAAAFPEGAVEIIGIGNR